MSNTLQHRHGRVFHRSATPETTVGRAGGFGLVELMVAMVIGLLGVIVMMQMFERYEQQKRTTTGGDDALSTGAIAMNGIQRELQHAGWGLTNVQVLGCNLTNLISGGAAIALRPVTINPAGITGDANTDTLLIITGNGNGSVEGDLINSQPAAGDPALSAASPNVYDVQAAAMFSPAVAGPPAVPADRVFAAPGTRANPCNVSMTTVTGVNRPNVAVTAGVAGMSGGRLFNLGSAPTVRAYAIRNGNLAVCDYVAADCTADTSSMTAAQVNALWVPIAENIVSMRVEYGLDTTAAPMDGIVDGWAGTIAAATSPRGAAFNAACGLMRASAVRLALVARSSQPEKTLDWPALTRHVTTNVPTWLGSATAPFTLPDPNGTWPTWQDFRYKVFQTVIPLRNITSQGAVPEC